MRRAPRALRHSEVRHQSGDRAAVVSEWERSDDVSCIERIAARDSLALGELYTRYGRVVFGVTYRMLGSGEAAEEATQDAFQSVWQRASTYSADRGAVRGWLLTIARNAAIDWKRTRGRHADRETELNEKLELLEEEDVDQRAIRDVDAADIRALVSALPIDVRQTLALAFWGGLSQREISERMGVPLGTVKSRVRSGLSRLRHRLDDGTDRT